jgi:hypothetical protein
MTGQGALETGMHAVITENDESQWNDLPIDELRALLVAASAGSKGETNA